MGKKHLNWWNKVWQIEICSTWSSWMFRYALLTFPIVLSVCYYIHPIQGWNSFSLDAYPWWPPKHPLNSRNGLLSSYCCSDSFCWGEQRQGMHGLWYGFLPAETYSEACSEAGPETLLCYNPRSRGRSVKVQRSCQRRGYFPHFMTFFLYPNKIMQPSQTGNMVLTLHQQRQENFEMLSSYPWAQSPLPWIRFRIQTSTLTISS